MSSKESVPKNEPHLVEEKDLLSGLALKKGSSLFLGKYSINEVGAVLKKRSFNKDAKKRNLWPVVFDLDSLEYPPLQRLQIFFKQKKPENMIVDLKIKEGIFRPKQNASFPIQPSGYKFLYLEWLTLQNPLQRFTSEKSPLPGQAYPGLNLGKKVMDLFIYLARLTKCDGLFAFPAYFHNALLFSRQFRFLNPAKEGEVLAVRQLFKKIPFKQLAWIVHLNCLKRSNGQLYEWKAEEQVYPINKTLIQYFDSREYKRRVREAKDNLRFSIDWDCFKEKNRDRDVWNEEGDNSG